VHVHVYRNNEFKGDCSLFDAIVFSPGPGLPENAGLMMDLLRNVEGRIPILGVCLGMQAIAIHCGGELYNQSTVKHGVQEKVFLEDSRLYLSLGNSMKVGLYHSWAVKEGVGDFRINARSESQVVMGIENEAKKMFGVQFHPESVLTSDGMVVVKNFIKLI